jgi:hypothetical protein
MNPRVKTVTAASEHKLHIEFTDGEHGIYECSPLLDFGVFSELKDLNYFKKAKAWDGPSCGPTSKTFVRIPCTWIRSKAPDHTLSADARKVAPAVEKQKRGFIFLKNKSVSITSKSLLRIRLGLPQSSTLTLQRISHMSAEIVSPNNWITKAGAYLSSEDKLVLPMKLTLVPLNNASKCIEEFEDNLQLDVRIRLVQTIGLNVRNADKAYFNEWSSILIEKNIHNETAVHLFGGCKNCFQKSLSANALREHVSPKLKQLSDANNTKIVHSMDTGTILQETDFHVAFDYYNCFMELNLMHFPEVKSLPTLKCKTCEKLTYGLI